MTEETKKRMGRPPKIIPAETVPESEVKLPEPEKKPQEASANNFLPAESRLMIINQLKSLGSKTDDLSDAQLIELMNKTTESLSKTQIPAGEIDRIQGALNVYADKTLLTDKDFIKKLYNLNVPKKFLELFRDYDKEMNRKQIWERIRKQKQIKQIDDLSGFLRRQR